MNRETFERVEFDGAESITPKLYKRVYFAAGKRRIRYYAIFTDWQHNQAQDRTWQQF